MPELHSKNNAFLLAALFAVSGGGIVGPTYADPARFQIAAGPAAHTLQQFAAQSHINILFDVEEVADRQTEAVAGTLEPGDALERMLRGSGLDFRFTRAASIAVRLVPTLDRPLLAVHEMPTVEVSGTRDREKTKKNVGGMPLPSVTSEDIRSSGAATLPELVQTLPQVFGGGPTQNTHDFGREAQNNSALGTGINLRGLGAGATLVLLNGRPLAPSGSLGEFVDISNIPLSAIDHIDFIPDAGSILYGPDAIGGVVNIVLRHEDGMELDSRFGARASQSIGERQANFSYGRRWESGYLTLGYEYSDKDALWASQRRQATSNLVPLGGSDFNTFAGNPGTLVSGSQTWAIPHNQNGTGLTPSDFASVPPYNEYDVYKDTTILPWENLQSVLASGSTSAGEQWNLFFDALGSRRSVRAQASGVTASLPVTSANPFYVNPGAAGADEEVLYDFQRDLGPLQMQSVVDGGQFTVGADYAGSGTWGAEAYGGYAVERERQTQFNQVNYSALTSALINPDTQQAFNPYIDGPQSSTVIDAIRGEDRYWMRSSVAFANATAEGTLAGAPGGNFKLTLGTEWRQEVFRDQTFASGQAPSERYDLSRNIWASFGSVDIPLIGEGNELLGLRKLVVSAGLRYQHYSDVGGVKTPQFGFSAALPRSVTFDGTWTRLFKAPNLSDLSESSTISEIFPLSSPADPSKLENALVLTGNNSSLRPETARVWTLGFTISSQSEPRTSFALKYFNTRYFNMVEESPDLSMTALSDPAFGPYTIHDVSPGEQAALCAQGQFLGAPGSCATTPIAAALDLRLHNRAVVETSGIDLNARYSVDQFSGLMTYGLLGTYLLDYSEAQTPTSPLTSFLNTEHYPINLRLRGSITWTRGSIKLAGFVNYQNGYNDFASVPSRRVSSWTTADATVTYEVADPGLFRLRKLSVSLSALNLFNTDPPFLNNSYEKIGYDEENGNLIGREVSVTVRAGW